MPRQASEMTAITVRRLATPGLHAVGGVAGLYLRISSSGAKYWIWRGIIGGRRRDAGIGPFPEVSLALARQKAAELRTSVREGNDPITERRDRQAERDAMARKRITLLQSLPSLADSPYVFPASRGGMLSDMALSKVMKRMNVDATPHGLRSTFRDWISESTSYPHEVAEQALAHVIPSAVERAYRRGNLLEKRRALMSDWATFLAG